MVAIAYEAAAERRGANVARLFVVAMISFLTLVDLFATQAILPSLTRAYNVTPAMMGTAVNLCTAGHGGRGPSGRAVQQADRPAMGRCRKPRMPCRDTDSLLGPDARSWNLRGLAPHPGRLHVGRLLTDDRLSRRECRPARGGGGARCLCHRQCRKQSLRPLDVGGDRRSLRLCRRILRSSRVLNLAGAVLAFFALRHTRPMQKMAASPEARPRGLRIPAEAPDCEFRESVS